MNYMVYLRVMLDGATCLAYTSVARLLQPTLFKLLRFPGF